ncbi:MAG: beta-propeller fold lactonase family protein [Deltaproteobacteria bacterium]|nr:beta-propeller fold lactonase family protein [Deltaproteobacteria bacterium]MBI2540239.1 beta-propeller fold lactonase family protein [Deltaproteobacteria bacterium]
MKIRRLFLEYAFFARVSIAPAAALAGGLFFLTPTATEGCPLVISAGPKQGLQAMMGGYCRINGATNPAAPMTGPHVRRRAFITNSDGDSISIIDRDTYKVVKTLQVGDYPHHMIVSLDGRYLYVGNTHSDTVSVLDLATEAIVKTVPLLDPYNLYYSPDRKLLVTTCTRLGRVEVHAVDEWSEITKAAGWKRLAQIPTGKDPNHFAFSPDGRFMYVSNEYSHQLSVLDLQGHKVIRQLNPGRRPVDVSLAPGGKMLFVAVYGEGRVTAYDTESFKELDRIPTGTGAHGMAMSVDGKTLFVSNRDASSVSAIDVATRKVTQNFSVPQGPDMLEVTPNGRELWVTSRYGASVNVIELSTGKMARRIRTGAAPHGIVLVDLAVPRKSE